MTCSKSLWLAAGLGVIFLAGLTEAQTGGQDRPEDKPKPPPAKPARPTKPAEHAKPPTRTVEPTKPPTKAVEPARPPTKTVEPARPPTKTVEPAKPPTKTAEPARPISKPAEPVKPPATTVKLETKPTAKGGYIKTAPSGQVRERVEKKADGEHTQHLAPTGKIQKEVVQKPDGTQQTTHYAPNGKVRQQAVVNRDGTRQTTSVQYGRSGTERARETISVDPRGKEVTRTVIVKQPTVIVQNTTIVKNQPIVRHYDHARYGFVYRPVYVVNSPVFVSWYDPYWYAPSGVVIFHPFRFSWGWNHYGWYHHHRHYWAAYDVYPAPSYWVTDWLIASYVADRYEASVSAAQAHEDARIAREEADRAMQAAQRARDEAEIAEAQAARAEAERRAANAEARAARAEAEEARANSGQPNPNATPIDLETKEALKNQIEKTIAEKKQIAGQAARGVAVVPDLSRALADPKHIYPVSTSINVILAADQSPAGTLTEGDLLKLEPGQEEILKNSDEHTFVTMRVMTSKGEEGEVKAGTLISVSLKSLQEFDSEFHAKLDLGLAEAGKNQDQFKKGVQK